MRFIPIRVCIGRAALPDSTGEQFGRRILGLHHVLRPGRQAFCIGTQYFLFDPQNLGGVHRKIAQAQAQQQAGQCRVTGHFSAQRDFFARCRALGDGVGEQTQYRRVQRVVQMRHLLVCTVDRQGVLNQVVRAH